MIRLTIAIIIFVLGSYIGFFYSDTFNKRHKELKMCYKAILMLKNQILFNNTPLYDSFMNIKDNMEYPYKDILEEVADKLINNETESIYEGFITSYKYYEKDIYLKEEDIKLLKDLIMEIGTTETYGQEKIINLTLENLKININEAESLAKSNCKMYRYLGVCFGLMIAILVI